MTEQPWVRAADGSVVGWHTGPPAFWAVLQQLGCLPRFAGATREPLSVLQHSLHVAWLLKSVGLRVEIVAAALLHDAAEIITGDTPTPFKPKEWGMPERVWVERACAAYGVGVEEWGHAWAHVKTADRAALHIEGAMLMPGEWCPPLFSKEVSRLREILKMPQSECEFEAARILMAAGCDMAALDPEGRIPTPSTELLRQDAGKPDEQDCPDCGAGTLRDRRCAKDCGWHAVTGSAR